MKLAINNETLVVALVFYLIGFIPCIFISNDIVKYLMKEKISKEITENECEIFNELVEKKKQIIEKNNEIKDAADKIKKNTNEIIQSINHASDILKDNANYSSDEVTNECDNEQKKFYDTLRIYSYIKIFNNSYNDIHEQLKKLGNNEGVYANVSSDLKKIVFYKVKNFPNNNSIQFNNNNKLYEADYCKGRITKFLNVINKITSSSFELGKIYEKLNNNEHILFKYDDDGLKIYHNGTVNGNNISFNSNDSLNISKKIFLGSLQYFFAYSRTN
ncbi:hypothetical protein TCON_2105 [Astathelohania contejeani]|uniref:Uncharacterized protein n=1 Tax=Astathelohania contejeani TaxID=164912 RepID=A0ABQ7HX09_9MICR|nr:hypothetical protein TCON_2105 [Thelohania contejeani]